MMGVAIAAKALRYSWASVGPIGSAGAQFLLSLVLLQDLSPREFGIFSFLLVASQFGLGVWSALFCAPLPTLFHSSEEKVRTTLLTCYFSMNLFMALSCLPFFWLLARYLSIPEPVPLLFAMYVTVNNLRGFARAVGHATGKSRRTVVSDIVYTLSLLGGVVFLALGDGSMHLGFAALLTGSSLGLLAFGRSYLKQQFCAISHSAVQAYLSVWKRHSGWSLLGVLTAEATANSHVYLVTALAGPTAFAPIAASALVIRPIGVALNALSEFERAQMAELIGDKRVDEARSAVGHFRIAVICIWILNVAIVGMLLLVYPRLVFPPEYEMSMIVTACAIWIAVAGSRVLRAPESTFMQSSGEFRALAGASVCSAIVSIASVLVLLCSLGVLWSLTGVLLGEIVFGLIVWQRCQVWSRGSAENQGGGRDDDH